MIHAGPHGYIVGAAGILSAVIQLIPTDPPALNNIKDLGTVGFLAVAVVFLWRKVSEKETDIKAKDDILMANYKATADALAANRALTGQMAETLTEIRHTVEAMANVRAVIAKP